MKFIRKRLKIFTVLIILILVVVLIILKIYLNNNSKIKKESIDKELELTDNIDITKEDTNSKEEQKIKKVSVDIKGAVNNPGVYEIESTKKVIDVINLAGGLTEKADTTLINLAKNVTNEMVVIVYTKEEVNKAKQENPIIKIVEKECVCPEIKNDGCIENIKENNKEELNVTISSKININTATLEELQTLDGIGESKAKAIIDYREKIKKFTTIEDLLEVSGIGEALYEKIKDNITV